MAEPILMTLTPPTSAGDSDPKFTGKDVKKQYGSDFVGSKYQRIIAMEDIIEIAQSDGTAQAVMQKPLTIIKSVDIDTPFFKWCCHKKKVIPEVKIHFFHTLKDDEFFVNFFTITLTNVLISKDRIIFHDYYSDKGKEKPYLEELTLTPQQIKWEYKRDKDPELGNFSTEFELS